MLNLCLTIYIYIMIHAQIILQNVFAGYKYGFIAWMKNSVGPDQLALLLLR